MRQVTFYDIIKESKTTPIKWNITMGINFSDRASLLPIYQELKLVEVEDLKNQPFFFAQLDAITMNVGEVYAKQHQRDFIISAPTGEHALVWLQLHLESLAHSDLSKLNEYKIDQGGTFIVISKFINPPSHMIRYPKIEDIKEITNDELKVLTKFVKPSSLTANFFTQIHFGNNG